MNPRHSLNRLLLAAVVALPLVSLPTTAAPAKPNIVFILADDLGWADLGCTGSKFYETPNIDRLAQRGLMFTQAYAAAPLCSPTRASLLTGLWPARIGITSPVCHQPEEFLEEALEPKARSTVKAIGARSATRLKLDYFTLGKAFKEAGYATGHFGKWHLGPEPYDPLHQGFDVDIPHTSGPGPGNSYLAPWSFPKKLNFTGEPGEHIEDRMASEAIRWLKAHKDQPFFLNYWAFSVHSPYDAKPALIEKYRAKAKPDSPQRNPLYAAMVQSLDENVGRLVQSLDELGLADNTIIVFFSDNGGVSFHGHPNEKNTFDCPITSNAPLRGGKGTIYEGGTREPCFITWPGVTQPGGRSEAIIQSIDFYPTLLEMAGLKPHEGQKFDGISFVPALKGAPLHREAIFCHYPHYTKITGAVPSSSVRKGDWKLIRDFADNDDQSDRFELYNLKEDIGETHNLADQQPEKVKELTALLDTFLKESHAVVPKANPDFKRPPAGATISEDWVPSADATVFIQSGQLSVTSTGNDAHIWCNEIPVGTGPFTLEFRMKSNSKGNGRGYWSTTPTMKFARVAMLPFTPVHDNEWHDYTLKLPVEKAIKALRINPCAGPGEMRIEFLRLTEATGRVVKEWRFDKAAETK